VFRAQTSSPKPLPKAPRLGGTKRLLLRGGQALAWRLLFVENPKPSMSRFVCSKADFESDFNELRVRSGSKGRIPSPVGTTFFTLHAVEKIIGWQTRFRSNLSSTKSRLGSGRLDIYRHSGARERILTDKD